MAEDYRALNLASWNERVPLHVRSEFYDVEGFKAGRSSLHPNEVKELGSVQGKQLVHLQCHFGLDTLSWGRRGAHVTGLDFSEPAITQALSLAADLKLDARFVVSDVYDAPTTLGERYDVVYTGGGALGWLPDIERWAQVVHDLLKPGGVLYLHEFHPTLWMLDDHALGLKYDYWTAPEGLVDTSEGTYTDTDRATEHNRTIVWNHPFSSLLNALIGGGLQLHWLHEHEYSLCQFVDYLVKVDERTWGMPEGKPRTPLMYSLLASKPS